MYYFIVNPSASSGRGRRIWHELKGILDEQSISYRAASTHRSGDAEALARTASLRILHSETTEDASRDVIIAVGGDGTANEVLNGLVFSDKFLFGYLPTGSGNDLARGLKLQTNPKVALETLLHPENPLSMRIGTVTTPDGHTRRFFISSGIGYDAAVCHEALHSTVKDALNGVGLGKLSYTGIALKQLITLKGTAASLTLDDGPAHFFDSIFFIAVMSLPYEGGGFMFCPDADATDEYLDVCVVETMSHPKALALLPTAYKGHHVTHPKVHIYRCKKAVIETDIPQAVHADGESLKFHSELQFGLEPEPLHFIIS